MELPCASVIRSFSYRARQKLVADFPKDKQYRYDLTVSQMNLSMLHLRSERYAQAESILRSCIGELENMPQQLKAESEYRRALAAAHLNLGFALEHQDKFDQAAPSYATGMRTLELLAEHHPQSVPIRQMLIDAANNLSKLLIGQSKYAEAIAPVDRAVHVYAELAAEFPDNAEYASELAKQRVTLDQLREAVSGKPAE